MYYIFKYRISADFYLHVSWSVFYTRMRQQKPEDCNLNKEIDLSEVWL